MEASRVREAQQEDARGLGRGLRRVASEGALELWRTARGEFWIPAGGVAALTWDLAEQDRDIYGRAPDGVRSGDVVLDCGANIGLFTRKALAAGAGLVVAIEPGPENVACLRKNFAREIEAGRVIVYPKGVWNAEMTLTFHVDPANSAADSFVVRRSSDKVIEIPVTTIDRLARELNLARVDFIKMDIEGSERQALEGAAATLRNDRPRMAISAYHLADDPVKLPTVVEAARSGYQVRCHCYEQDSGTGPEVMQFY